MNKNCVNPKTETSAAGRTRRFQQAYGGAPSSLIASSSPSSIVGIYAASSNGGRWTPAHRANKYAGAYPRSDKFPTLPWPNSIADINLSSVEKGSNGGGGKRRRAIWPLMARKDGKLGGGRVHLHTLYLIMCIVLANLVLLLCLLHFKFLVVFPVQHSAATEVEVDSSSTPAAQQSHRHKHLSTTNSEKHKNASAVKSLELAVHPARISRPDGWKSQQAYGDISVDGKTKPDEAPATPEEKEISGEARRETALWEEIALDKIELHFLREPFESNETSTNDGNSNSLAGIGNGKTTSFPSIPTALPIKADPASSPYLELPFISTSTSTSIGNNQQQKQQQFIVDCQTENDAQGDGKCVEWKRAGFCETHPATKWLFCRRNCFCQMAENDGTKGKEEYN